MGILSGFPAGLLSLVGSQSFGSAPKDLGEIISPVVDVGELYLLSAQVGTVRINPAPANGSNANNGLLVPAGEVWRVHAGGLFILTGGAASVDTITPIVNVSGATLPIGNTKDGGIAINSTWWEAMTQPPFWLRSGSELSVYISGLTGVPTISVSYLVSKLRA